MTTETKRGLTYSYLASVQPRRERVRLQSDDRELVGLVLGVPAFLIMVYVFAAIGQSVLR